MFRRIDANMLVAGQIHPEDVGRAVEQGVTLIVNNRPDGEIPGQPPGAEIEAAARLAGIGYRHLPVSHQGITPEQVSAMIELLGSGERLLAFCAVGLRSTILWALARRQAGDTADEIIGKAAQAGYDLSGLRSRLGPQTHG
jgi:uncharacterized protein (TIGR01244 family)